MKATARDGFSVLIRLLASLVVETGDISSLPLCLQFGEMRIAVYSPLSR